MIDNRNCVSVRISTLTDGENFVTEAAGRIFQEGENYRLVFAERSESGLTRSEIKIEKNRARLHREGAINSDMVFDASAETPASYSTSGLSAEFLLRTKKYCVSLSEDYIVIDLDYSLFDGNNGGIGEFCLKIEVKKRDPACR